VSANYSAHGLVSSQSTGSLVLIIKDVHWTQDNLGPELAATFCGATKSVTFHRDDLTCM